MVEKKTIEVYETSNGERFDDWSDAIEHEKELIIENYLPFIDSYDEAVLKYIITYKNEIFRLLMCGRFDDGFGNTESVIYEGLKERMFDERNTHDLEEMKNNHIFRGRF